MKQEEGSKIQSNEDKVSQIETNEGKVSKCGKNEEKVSKNDTNNGKVSEIERNEGKVSKSETNGGEVSKIETNEAKFSKTENNKGKDSDIETDEGKVSKVLNNEENISEIGNKQGKHTIIECQENLGMVTMSEEEYNALEKEYLDEKEAEKINAQHIESEKRNAEKNVRHIVQRRMAKGYRPSKAIEELLSYWIEQCDVTERPIVVQLPDRQEIERIHSDVVPEFSGFDKTYFAIQAIKWKTRKEKYLGEHRDSPINIETDKVKKCKYYKKLYIRGLWNEDKQSTIYNAGNSVRGTISGEALLSNGPLFGNYQFQDFSLKFGDASGNGTEHSINGQRFALEFHLNFSASSGVELPPRVLKARSSKAVLVVLFEENRQQRYYELFSLIPHLDKKGKQITLTNNLLSDFKEILLSSDYYNYTGSSSEKPFTPNVEWFIFKNIQPIHKTQIELLWQLRKNGGLKPTIRPIQPLGERVVFQPSYHYYDKCRGNPIFEF